eukprot:TRINITY_DN61330_c0_g1_i1.p1 TRINITY_DN61330_c0_g1~~TRINITY_DN61330_c0_g1_i1.p1  ORF type:complete len:952 (-),score=239.62 TRINITY_DN61330_c0_g1_i1:40-2895(-)
MRRLKAEGYCEEREQRMQALCMGRGTFALAVPLLTVVLLCQGCFDSQERKADLTFDLSSPPPLASDRSLFPDAYREQMRWGTYRPGVYFGVKGRHPGSLLMGIAWGSADGKLLRHECESGELQAFNWLEHDGESYGLQSIQDQKLGLHLNTTFAKEGASVWHARAAASQLVSSEPAPKAKERLVSFFLYLGVEDGEPHGLNLASAEEAQSTWEKSEEDLWHGRLQLQGTDPSAGAFSATVVISNVFSHDSERPPWRYVSARVPHEVEARQAEASLTGVWDAKKHLKKHLRKVESKAESKGEGQEQQVKKQKRLELPDKAVDSSPNFVALQVFGHPSKGFKVDVSVKFGEAGRSTSEEGARIDELAYQHSEAFKNRLADVFSLDNLEEKGALDTREKAAVAGAAVSGLLGGLGYFRGRLLAKAAETESDEEVLERLPAAVLFSGVPSRSFFPRGFLWDEGFHGLILARWQPRVFLDVLSHWLELQQPTGWIPREVPLGAEQEVRVPKQFLPQDPTVANPPSFLLPLAWLVRIAARSAAGDSQARLSAAALARRTGLNTAEELQQLVLSFGSAALPRLAAWFAFLDKTQRSSNPAGCYKWAGRTAAHCLASGLDDYPRGLLVNEDECHLDLHSWMTLFARTLASLCQQLGGTGALTQEQRLAYCIAPEWETKASKLNATLHGVFVDGSKKSDAPLADFIGKQPAKGSKVMVVPPWRSDGRCGPQFPVQGSPGECDPYGGAPCCSPSGWCGGSPDFCDCPGCKRSQKLEERKKGAGSKTVVAHSPHLGYVSLFPLLLGLLPCDHPRALPLLKALQPRPAGSKPKKLWSEHGVMSLAAEDPLWRQGEDYWRGKIWANLNYLTISALHRCAAEGGDEVKELAREAYASSRDGFVRTVLGALQKQKFFFENFDPGSGEGRGVGPFTGWTTLVALVVADLPLALDFQEVQSDTSKTDL